MVGDGGSGSQRRLSPGHVVLIKLSSFFVLLVSAISIVVGQMTWDSGFIAGPFG